jgi:D-beta-D-heptose 7-phosphate kinase/D-beta-D-heptose 1-phosphate adenosyltransferase
VPVIVDPKAADLAIYRGCTAITPNRREAETGTGMTIGDEASIEEAARRIARVTDASIVLITLGERGMALWAAAGELRMIASRAREVFDVTGAGDTVLAYFGLGLAAGHDPKDAAEIANLAAGVKVGKVGTSAIAPFEIDADAEAGTTARKHVDLPQAIARCERWRSLGKSVVFTNGCFDLLHAGHIHLLERARRLGDVLVVALNTDASVKRLKGADRPLVSETDRAKVIAALDAVDLVLLFDEDTPLEILRRLRPDVLVKGGDYSVSTIVGADLVQDYGGRVETVPLVPGRSTSSLVEAARKAEN